MDTRPSVSFALEPELSLGIDGDCALFLATACWKLPDVLAEAGVELGTDSSMDTVESKEAVILQGR